MMEGLLWPALVQTSRIPKKFPGGVNFTIISKQSSFGPGAEHHRSADTLLTLRALLYQHEPLSTISLNSARRTLPRSVSGM